MEASRFGLPVLMMLLSIELMSQSMSVQTYNMRDGLSQMKVSCLFEDRRGYIWVGTRNGLNRFDGDNFQIFSTQDGLLNNRILGVRENAKGEILILSAGGISVFDGSHFKNYPMRFSKVLYRIYQDEFGYLYIFGKSVHAFHPSKGVFKVHDELQHVGFDDRLENLVGLSRDSIFYFSSGTIIGRAPYAGQAKHWLSNAIFTDKMVACNPHATDSVFTFSLIENDWVAVGTMSRNKGNLIPYDYCYQDSLVLKTGDRYYVPYKRIFCMLKTKSNNYFIGADDGLIRFIPTSFQKISTDDVPYAWSIVDSKEKIYFGNYGGGLSQMDKATNSFSQLDSKIDLYHCGASTDGLGSYYFSNTLGVSKLKEGVVDLINLGVPVLYNLYDAQRKSLVLGVDHGIAMIDSVDNVVYRNKIGLFHENHYIQTITIGPQGDYWCGSYSGLTRYQPEEDSFVHFTTELNNLPIGPGVFSGAVGNEGRLWLGGSNGLCWFDKHEEKLVKINSPLLNEQIKSIIEISSGTLLLGAKNELLIFDSQKFFEQGLVDVNFYNASNGYEGMEAGYTGSYQDLEKNIWLTSASHTSRLPFPHKLLKNNLLRAQIISVDDHKMRFNTTSDTVVLKSNENIVVHVEAVGLDRPAVVKYAYRINEGAWSEWQIDDQFVIAKLNHGQHLLEVATGPTSQQMKGIATAHVVVVLPLVQRDFFIPLLLTILALFAFYTLYLWWKRREERQVYLMQLEESRYLRSQLLLSELNPHFIFNVLAAIQNKILKGDKVEANNKLVQLSSLIRNFLNVSFKSNDPKNKLEHEITLDREIELLTSYLEFEQSNSNNHFDYVIHLAESVEPTQIMIPPMIIQPFVENAVKHGVLPMAQKGLVELRFSYKDNVLFCEVMDNGQGIKESKRDRKISNRKSLGSKIVNERIAALNQIGYYINVNIKQRITGGTAVLLTIQE